MQARIALSLLVPMLLGCAHSWASDTEGSVAVGVIPFGYSGSDTRWVAEKLMDFLGDRFEENSEYDLVDFDDLEDAFDDLGFDTDQFRYGVPPEMVSEAGSITGSDMIIFGFVTPCMGETFQISWSISVVASENTISPAPINVQKNSESVSEAASAMVASVGIEVTSRAQDALNMADYHISTENWPMAIMSLKQAISTDPGLTDARVRLAEIYARDEVDSLDKAEEIYTQILATDATNSQALEGMGEVELSREDYDRAREYFQTAIDANPDNAEAYMGLAKAFRSMGRTDEAVQNFEAALAQNPDNLQARYALGLLYVELEDYEKSIPHLLEVLDSRPDFSNLRLKLISAYTELGQYGKAADQAQILLESQPDNSELVLYTARMEALAGRTSSAIDRLEGLIASTGNRQAYITLATIYRDIGNRGAMQNVFSRLKSAYPADPVANYMMGAFYYHSGTAKAQVSDLVPENVPVWRSAVSELQTAISYLNQVTGYRAERAQNMVSAASNAISLCEEKIDRVERYSQ